MLWNSCCGRHVCPQLPALLLAGPVTPACPWLSSQANASWQSMLPRTVKMQTWWRGSTPGWWSGTLAALAGQALRRASGSDAERWKQKEMASTASVCNCAWIWVAIDVTFGRSCEWWSQLCINHELAIIVHYITMSDPQMQEQVASGCAMLHHTQAHHQPCVQCFVNCTDRSIDVFICDARRLQCSSSLVNGRTDHALQGRIPRKRFREVITSPEVARSGLRRCLSGGSGQHCCACGRGCLAARPPAHCRAFAAQQQRLDVAGTLLGTAIYLSLLRPLWGIGRNDLMAAVLACALACPWPLLLMRSERGQAFYLRHRDILFVIHQFFHHVVGGQLAR